MSEFKKESLTVKKPRPALIEPKFLLAISEVLSDGAEEYGANNWKKCPDVNIFWDALLRHLIDAMLGKTRDKKSGKHPLAHAACDLMFIYYLTTTKDSK